jgi:predicted metalloprotease with PDZ domain
MLGVVVFVASWTASTAAQPPVQPLAGGDGLSQVDGGGGASGAGQPRDAEPPPYFGVVVEDLLDEGGGVRIANVAAGSPAQEAGLVAGDLVLAIDSAPVHSADEVARLAQSSRVGQRLLVQLERDGARLVRQVTLSAGPRAASEESLSLGVETQALDLDTIRRLRVPVEEGVVVTNVTPNSPAALGAMPLGAVIINVNGQPVATPAEFEAAVAQLGEGSTVRLTYFIGGRRLASVFSLRPTLGATPNTESQSRDAALRTYERMEQRIDELERRILALERMVIDLSR